jgi:hypothetical protein
MWRGALGRGWAAQTYKLSEPSVVDGTTANSLAANCRRPAQHGAEKLFRVGQMHTFSDSSRHERACALHLPRVWMLLTFESASFVVSRLTPPLA